MTTFERVYTDEQKEAAVSAYLDRGIRPQRRIVELAAEGRLIYRSMAVEPFKLNLHTLRDMLVHERRRRAGLVRGEAARMTHDDAVEALRTRLVNVADSTLTVEEKRDPAKRDPERIRQIVRVVREIAALPGKGEGRTTAPGHRHNGVKQGGATEGGIGGHLIAAMRRSTAPEHPTEAEGNTENADPEPSDDRSNAGEAGAPGTSET